MLLQFSVENFKSFKEQAVLSMEASKDIEPSNNIVVIGRDRCLKSAVIFGANGAGKSNIFEALTAAITIIRESSARQINAPLSAIVPFRFSQKSVEMPTSFEFVFITEGKKYVYGFSATQKAVLEEYLYVFNSSSATVIFEREASENYRYTVPEIQRELKPIEERNTENKLFLATATMWNCEVTRAPFLWFEEQINTCPISFDQLLPHAAQMFGNDADASLKQFTIRILHEADINIDNYEFEAREMSLDQLPKELQQFISTIPVELHKTIHIETVHTIEDNEAVQKYNLELSEESQGTQNLFMFSPILKKAFETGETLCVDEFGASLHPALVLYLFNLFSNPEINKANAQLIISSHETALLSLERLRRDQIYFVEKKRKTGASELYSLDEFSQRASEDIRKAYLLGRYGSVPDIPEEASLW